MHPSHAPVETLPGSTRTEAAPGDVRHLPDTETRRDAARSSGQAKGNRGLPCGPPVRRGMLRRPRRPLSHAPVSPAPPRERHFRRRLDLRPPGPGPHAVPVLRSLRQPPGTRPHAGRHGRGVEPRLTHGMAIPAEEGHLAQEHQPLPGVRQVGYRGRRNGRLEARASAAGGVRLPRPRERPPRPPPEGRAGDLEGAGGLSPGNRRRESR